MKCNTLLLPLFHLAASVERRFSGSGGGGGGTLAEFIGRIKSPTAERDIEEKGADVYSYSLLCSHINDPKYMAPYGPFLPSFLLATSTVMAISPGHTGVSRARERWLNTWSNFHI